MDRFIQHSFPFDAAMYPVAATLRADSAVCATRAINGYPVKHVMNITDVGHLTSDADTGEVLMMAYMNRQTLEMSLEKRETFFWSRSRQEIWHKGATSGHTQQICRIETDCDRDTLLILVDPRGPACHTNSFSCFFNRLFSTKEEKTLWLRNLEKKS
jgi:phosphoribosyl-AMP cyclohydrolase